MGKPVHQPPQRIARLRVRPSFGLLAEAPGYTLTLLRVPAGYRLEAISLGKPRQRRKVDVDAVDAERWLAALKKATVPAFPCSPMVCDGRYLELTVEGESSTLTLSWWTVAPAGAEVVEAFAMWMDGLIDLDQLDASSGSQLQAVSPSV